MNKRVPNPVIPDYTQKKRGGEQEVTLLFTSCCNCGKTIVMGYYGRHGDGGTCSKKCESEQAQKPLDFGEGESS